jgi:phosphatidylglycerophosphatase A
MPDWLYFFDSKNITWTIGIILLFRFFDIVKPWPIGPSQDLPKGWGITIDDLIAALFVNIIIGLVTLLP